MKLYPRGLFVFTRDLRLHDQPALKQASDLCARLTCIYILPNHLLQPHAYTLPAMGDQRLAFLQQSLCNLKDQLNELGHELHVFIGNEGDILERIVNENKINAVFASRLAGSFEQQRWGQLQKHHPAINIHLEDTHTLFKKEQLDFSQAFYTSFSQFRKKTKYWQHGLPIAKIETLPPAMPVAAGNRFDLTQKQARTWVQGGEAQGLKHLYTYFNTSLALQYKATRNALDGWDNSSKFSLWLADGCLSPRLLRYELQEFEALHGKTDSTEHLHMELLWREFFQWYSHYYQNQLFHFAGINKKRPLTSFYPLAFRQWLEGHTEWPLVNACMNQLRETGYMSNRGRQIVASCLVNELNLDWRAGAHAFEHYLLDYDVASNWGNWQYIAGVGPDPRGGRHFNIEKQTQLYDPQGLFIEYWQGNETSPTHSVDAADWPIQ